MNLRDFIYKSGWVFAWIIILINLIFYSYLPNNVVTQGSFTGAATPRMPKITFILFLLILQIFIYLIVKFKVRVQLIEIRMSKIISYIAYIDASLLFIAVDIIVIYMNLWDFAKQHSTLLNKKLKKSI